MSSAAPMTPKHKIPFGLRAGVMVHVQNVAYGKNCGCVCAECLQKLVACNREPRKVAKYFRHANGAECPGGYETAIHRAAKEVLLRRREVSLPGCDRRVSFCASDGREFSEVVALTSQKVIPEEAYEESWQEGIRPDVVFVFTGKQIYIEVRVTHAVDELKKQKIMEKGCRAIEIDLGNLTPIDLLDMDSFERRVCHALDCRSWVFWPDFEEMVEDAMVRQRGLRDAHELRLKELEERRRLSEQAKQDRLRREAEQKAKAAEEKAAEDAKKRNKARHKYAAVLARLPEAEDRERIAAWNDYQQGYSTYTSPQASDLKSAEFLLAKTDGFWIFNARYQDWQAYVLDLLFPPVPIGSPISLGALKKAVMGKFHVIPWVKAINDLEYARKQYPQSEAGLVLLTAEVGVVPDAYAAISNYIRHLSVLRLCGQRLERIEGDRSITLQEALKRYRKWQEEKQDRLDLQRFAARMRSEEEREYMAQLRETSAEKARKLENAVRASELIVFLEHKGQGLRCESCYLVSPGGSARCAFCNQPGLLRNVIIDEEFLRTSSYRMRSSANFNKIVSNMQSHVLDSLQPMLSEIVRGDVSDEAEE